MKIWLSEKNKEKSEFKADFVLEQIVPTQTYYLLTYKFDTSTWIINNPPKKDFQTDSFSIFHFTRLHHIIYGYFEYKGLRYDAQVGAYLRQVGVQGFDHVLISHRPWGDPVIFENPSSGILLEKTDIVIIDLEDFNNARKLIGQEEYTFNQYVAKKLSNTISDENGLTLQDETTLFSILTDKFDPTNLMSSKGMSVFLEEQAKRNPLE